MKELARPTVLVGGVIRYLLHAAFALQHPVLESSWLERESAFGSEAPSQAAFAFV